MSEYVPDQEKKTLYIINKLEIGIGILIDMEGFQYNKSEYRYIPAGCAITIPAYCSITIINPNEGDWKHTLIEPAYYSTYLNLIDEKIIPVSLNCFDVSFTNMLINGIKIKEISISLREGVDLINGEIEIDKNIFQIENGLFTNFTE
jgi:hypothetical protein